MEIEKTLKIIEEKFEGKSKEIIKKQFENYCEAETSKCLFNKKTYILGDDVVLKKGTLLHGTYKNIEGLRKIAAEGLISSEFMEGRITKYPSCVGVWNLKKDYLLKDYINFYSGATVKYNGLLINNEYSQENKTDVIPYDKMSKINEILFDNQCRIWYMEQTKEARFMPSLAQNVVQIGVIFNADNEYVERLVEGDILNPKFIDDAAVKAFVNPKYYENFIEDRKNKDDFFSDRESAIIYGIPSNSIEGILVGREYEENKIILKEIKALLPNVYICNLDGKVIVEN